MKKVLALVLALIMVCTMAMAIPAIATPDKFDLYEATADNLKNGKLKANVEADVEEVTITPVAAVTNDNGTGTLAYLAINGDKYVKTTTPTVSDFAVTKAGKTDILYYVTEVTDEVEYHATAKAFTDFGSKCGQILRTDINAKYYVLTNTEDKGDVYKADDDGVFYVLVDGKVIRTSAANDEVKVHNWVVSKVGLDKDNNTIPTEVSCPVCGLKTTAIYKEALAPAGTALEMLDAPYDAYGFVVPTTATTTTTTNPDTGANDVIGVAAALAVVALVSGAAISLKK